MKPYSIELLDNTSQHAAASTTFACREVHNPVPTKISALKLSIESISIPHLQIRSSPLRAYLRTRCRSGFRCYPPPVDISSLPPALHKVVHPPLSAMQLALTMPVESVYFTWKRSPAASSWLRCRCMHLSTRCALDTHFLYRSSRVSVAPRGTFHFLSLMDGVGVTALSSVKWMVYINQFTNCVIISHQSSAVLQG